MVDDFYPPVAVVPRRRSPRLRRGGPLIKLRITAATEAQAEQARLLLEQLLASLSCRMQPARAGRNPKYAEAPAWLSYGELELPPSARRPTDS